MRETELGCDRGKRQVMGAYLARNATSAHWGTRAVFISRKLEIDGGKVIITVRHEVYTVRIMQC